MRGWAVGYIGLAIFSNGNSSMLSKTLASDYNWHNGRARMTTSQPKTSPVASDWPADSSVAVLEWTTQAVGIDYD